jgi:cholesterol transport system auxiliary component
VKALYTAAAAVSLSLALGGCALLGLAGGKNPVQLYRFGGEAGAQAAPVATTATTIQLTSLSFAPASEGDRLLAITGAEASYIAASRWVAPARDLFAEAAERAFDRAGLRLSRRNQPFETDANLVLEVPTFEARYLNGAGSAPVVVVEVRASLVQGRGREVLGETAYTVRQPAGENRVSAIVMAFDQASRQALDQTAAWAAATAARAPRQP